MALKLVLCLTTVIVFVTSASIKGKDDSQTAFASTKNNADSKHKRSNEELKFGNQQNQPAGMVDYQLSGFAVKKADIPSVAVDPRATANDSSGSYDTSEREENQKETLYSEGGTEYGVDDNEANSLGGDSYSRPSMPFQSNFRERGYSEREPDLDFPFENDLREAGVEWEDYPEYFPREVLQRRRRTASEPSPRQRNIRSSLEHLLSNRDKADRSKRELRMNTEEILSLLQQFSENPRLQDILQQGVGDAGEYSYRLENNNLEPIAMPDRVNYDQPMGNYLDDPVINEENNGNFEGEEIPDWMLQQGPRLDLKSVYRRSLYPPMDYRVFGFPGEKRKRIGWEELGNYLPEHNRQQDVEGIGGEQDDEPDGIDEDQRDEFGPLDESFGAPRTMEPYDIPRHFVL